ncbi:MAG: M1 family aminopeptidase [Acidimicrobiales bacterium]
MRQPRLRRTFATAVAGVVVLASCSSGDGAGRAAQERPPSTERTAAPAVDLRSASLSAAGRTMAAESGLDDAPRYDLDAVIEPETGEVTATMTAEVPAPSGAEPLRFRVFPNLPALDAGFRLSYVVVDGEAVAPVLDRSILTLAPSRSAERVRVEMAFSYTVPVTDVATNPLAALGGDALDPAEIGLLGRHEGGLSLGHWFPVWLPPGTASEPEPDGFGDIGNFPAATFAARIEVPAPWQVFTGGTTTDRRYGGGRVTYLEEGVGLRDLSVYAGIDVTTTEVDVDGVTVRVVGRPGHAEVVPEVAEESAAALSVLAGAFGPYPWSELDVLDVPLGSGVGGMEWPGVVWIETATFGGGIPGLGALEGLDGLLGGDSGLAELFGGGALGSLRESIVAHEVAHQWWHALVGNDSIAAPVVDEPLAQFSACHYFRVTVPAEGDELCAFHTEGQYQMLRSLGEPDAPANQATDQFSSSLQYGAVVYGKAPGLYEELRQLVGDEALLSALRAYVESHRFAVATPEDLRAALRAAGTAGGHEEAVDALWVRWMEQAHGDEDIGAASPLGGLDGLEGLRGTGPGEEGDLEELLEELLEGLGEQ